MKTIKFGNILDVTSGIIVHGCNAQGVMGSGIAKEVKAKWPKAFENYNLAVKKGPAFANVGAVIPVEVEPGLIIANAITQENFGRERLKYVSYQGVQECFISIVRMAFEDKLHVHYPLIGAGLGGGDWAIISEIIDNVFDSSIYKHVDRTLWIYE